MSRHGGPLQAIYETRGWDDDPRDWDVGGPEGKDIRRKGGNGVTVPFPAVITGAPVRCRLCEPGYVCAFHREDQ